MFMPINFHCCCIRHQQPRRKFRSCSACLFTGCGKKVSAKVACHFMGNRLEFEREI